MLYAATSVTLPGPGQHRTTPQLAPGSKNPRYTLLSLADLLTPAGAVVSANVKQRYVSLNEGPVLKIAHERLPVTGIEAVGPEVDKANVEQLLLLTQSLHPTAAKRWDAEQDSWIIFLPAQE